MASYDASDLVPFLRDAAAAIGATVADAPPSSRGLGLQSNGLNVWTAWRASPCLPDGRTRFRIQI